MKKGSYSSIGKNLALIFLAIVFIGLTVRILPFRLDLTEEKKYSLHPSSIEVLKSLEEPVEVDILLTGKLPGGMRRLQRSIEETVRTFNAYSNQKITFYYEDPLNLPESIREDYIVGLSEYGINPTNLFITEEGGQKSKLIFPGVLVRTEEYETGALLLKGEKGMGPDEILNQSIENLEYELIQAIKKVSIGQEKSVGMTISRGEMNEDDGFGIVEALVDQHEVFKIPLADATKADDLDPFDVIIVPGPKEAYSEKEIYFLDQYLMRGGNLIFLIDAMEYDLAEAGGEGTIAMPRDHGLDQLLFRYGIRVNKDLIQDLDFGYHPVIAGNFGNQEQIIPLPWPFYIAAGRMAKHPITKGLDQVMFRFVSSLDTVKADGVKKTPLIFGSDLGRKINSPVRIAFEDMSREPNLDEFGSRNLPLLYLLEGEFISLFKNRFLPDGVEKSSFLENSNGGRVLVAGTGLLFKSQKSFVDGNPLPLGDDPFNNTQYANRQLLQNAVNYLLEPEGIMATRTKILQIRPLNKIKVREEKTKWQIVNILVPVFFFVILGLIWTKFRKRKYGN
ncbi:gliding motility-associated ABC transporter substrate-binding protein GldG [Cecembia rubra]|uniref:Gliding-associated putative ABC transporter substrate-binding component GldG n=1 Tax=Cecembia rubra TaxID=1485585 RepID=A0A2P8DXM6_9BACT|nr:gliding motility-associated ABC transporter substrate-binding protein GldG [Cecembia rubra]PSL01978.1 gliding-associated putative ABC transporter substrate-binding component GldG [Cecembia rubra]